MVLIVSSIYSDEAIIGFYCFANVVRIYNGKKNFTV